MKPEDVDQVFDGATPNRYAALSNNAVQCAILSQPFDFRAIAEGYTQLADISFYGKEYAFVVVAARQSWAKNNPETARAFLARYRERDRLVLRARAQGRRDRHPGRCVEAEPRADRADV